MAAAAREIATEAGWRLKTFVRCQQFCTTLQMVPLCAGLLGSGSNAILKGNLALEVCRLVPLEARRDVAMLGMLQRVANGMVPSELATLFAPTRRRTAGMTARTSEARHDLQLLDFVSAGGHTDSYKRSAFVLVTVCNMLPDGACRGKECEGLAEKSAASFEGIRENWRGKLETSLLDRSQTHAWRPFDHYFGEACA